MAGLPTLSWRAWHGTTASGEVSVHGQGDAGASRRASEQLGCAAASEAALDCLPCRKRVQGMQQIDGSPECVSCAQEGQA